MNTELLAHPRQMNNTGIHCMYAKISPAGDMTSLSWKRKIVYDSCLNKGIKYNLDGRFYEVVPQMVSVSRPLKSPCK